MDSWLRLPHGRGVRIWRREGRDLEYKLLKFNSSKTKQYKTKQHYITQHPLVYESGILWLGIKDSKHQEMQNITARRKKHAKLYIAAWMLTSPMATAKMIYIEELPFPPRVEHHKCSSSLTKKRAVAQTMLFLHDPSIHVKKKMTPQPLSHQECPQSLGNVW